MLNEDELQLLFSDIEPLLNLVEQFISKWEEAFDVHSQDIDRCILIGNILIEMVLTLIILIYLV